MSEHIALRAYFEEFPSQRRDFTLDQIADADAALKAHPANSRLLESKLETHVPEIAKALQARAMAHAINYGV